MCVPGTRVVHILIAALVLLVLTSLPAIAIEQLQVQLGNIDGADWSAADVSMAIDWIDGDSFRVTLQASRARFPEPLGLLEDIILECPVVRFNGTEISCGQGSLHSSSRRLGVQQVGLALHYRLADRRLQLAAQGLRYLGGLVSLQAVYSDNGWQAGITAHRLVLPAVLHEVRALGYEVPALEGDGQLDAEVDMEGSGVAIGNLQVDAQLNSPSFSNAAGTLAGENVGLQLVLHAQPRGKGWRLAVDGSFRTGALYAEPVYVEAGERPLSLQARLDWLPGRQLLVLDSLEFRHPDVLDVTASGRLRLATAPVFEKLQARLRSCRMPACYSSYMQPWLHGTLGGQLETGGSLAAELQVQAGQPRALLVDLQQVEVQDTEGRFDFTGLGGRLDWAADGPARQSQLSWRDGQVYRLALGPAALAVESTADSLRLLEPSELPVLDGVLQLESLQLARPAGQELRWSVDGILTPVSMSLLTAALGWPEFGGKLSGVIPDVRYADGELTVGGVLLVRVFDGEVTLRDVRLSEPFGPVPRLRLDALVRNIDLESLTRTFSFGRIEGRLDGHVDGLVMESWRPVAFDAGFATPDGDRSRHRISQKAVDSISNIGGGGISGALSRSFLRFFKDFPYDRLGLYCRLSNGTCEMHGVEEAEQGYYIVKGRFLPPRLDVIGFADRVNWDQLVAQVIAVTGSQSAAVE